MEKLNVDLTYDSKLAGLNLPKRQTDEFHRAFGHKISEKPTSLSRLDVLKRVRFIGEELVELLATVAHDEQDLYELNTELMSALEVAERKERSKVGTYTDPIHLIVGQADALTDINYFTQGTFTMMGVEPQPLFNIVQEANMNKLGPDGKVIYRESDGKIMKPEGWSENWAPEPKLHEEIKRQINK